MQAPRVRAAVGPDHRGALRRHRREVAPVPLRRAGQLARTHRGAAGEQRAADRARDARRDPVARRPRPRGAAARVERGARPAPAVGPAVVAAHPAGAGVRDGSARVRGHLRGIDGRRGKTAELDRGRGRRTRLGARRWWRLRDDRRHEGSPGTEPRRTGSPHRNRRDSRRRGQLLHRGCRFTPRERRRRAHPGGGSRGRARADRAPAASGAALAIRRGGDRASSNSATIAATRENLVPATIELARAGGTVGEWAGALREVFGEYRAPYRCRIRGRRARR